MTASIRKISREQLRSRLWFDNPDNPGITALYIARNLNYSLAGAELQGSKPVHLNAIARHVGVPLDCADWERVGFEIPLLVDMQPAGGLSRRKMLPHRGPVRHMRYGS